MGQKSLWAAVRFCSPKGSNEARAGHQAGFAETAWRQLVAAGPPKSCTCHVMTPEAFACRAGPAGQVHGLTIVEMSLACRAMTAAAAACGSLSVDCRARYRPRPAAAPRAARRWRPSPPPAGPQASPLPRPAVRRRSSHMRGSLGRSEPAGPGRARHRGDCCRPCPAVRFQHAADPQWEATRPRPAAGPSRPPPPAEGRL